MPLWQDLAVVLLVTLAVLYLARRVWLIVVRRRAGGCGTGSCPSCPAGESQEAAQRGFVALDQLADPRRGPKP